MIQPSNKIPPPTVDWVLVANASRARSFVRDDKTQALRELASFVHPETRLKGIERGEERGGRVFKGAASTQFAPHTEPRTKLHAEFAHELAQVLEDAALAHRFTGVSIIATAGFLGVLRSHLGPATQHLLRGSVALDLTLLQGPELEQRVTRVLQDEMAPSDGDAAPPLAR